jgi:hypothetical protein
MAGKIVSGNAGLGATLGATAKLKNTRLAFHAGFEQLFDRPTPNSFTHNHSPVT